MKTFVRRVRGEAEVRVAPDDPGGHPARSRRLRRTSVAVGLTALVAVGCSGPEVPLSVGLADRPVDLLLGQRVADVAEAPVPPVAIPPAILPDFDLPLPAPFEFDFTVPPTSAYSFPSFATTTTTLPAGCVATPPTRTFTDSPDNIMSPPLETKRGDKGYVTRTEGKIEVDSDTIAATLLPTLTNRRIENVQVLARYPAGQNMQYSDKSKADGKPADFTFDVVADVGKPENNSRTTYRVQPGYIKIVYNDYYRFDVAADGKKFMKYDTGVTKDGIIDDFFTDLNKDGDISDAGEQYPDWNHNGVLDAPDYYPDLDGDGVYGEYPQEYYIDTNGNGTLDFPDEYHYDMNGNGKIDYAVDPDGAGPLPIPPDAYREDNYYNSWPNMRKMEAYKPDGVGDSPTATPVKGGIYLVSMLTGTKDKDRVTFSKVKDATGALVDAPGAKIAELPFVESATINTEAYTADGGTSMKFESTVFGRVDVDVCRTDMVAWKVALDRGFIASSSAAMNFEAEYSIASQHGGLFLQDKSAVTSIQAGSPTVKRTIESVFTTEPAAAADPDPPHVG